MYLHTRHKFLGCIPAKHGIVTQLLNNFLQLAAEDTRYKKTIVTLMCEAMVEAGLTTKSGNTETIVKQMRPHIALTCGTTFTDALGKMVERKQVIALFGVHRSRVHCVAPYCVVQLAFA